MTKGLSLEPLAGNPPVRIAETRGGMLNSIGLQNIGVDRFLNDVLPGLAGLPPKVIVNLFGYDQDDYVRLAERVDPHPGVAAVELNVSCPNVSKGGIEFGHDPDILYGLVRRVRSATGKPVVVKLSPNVTSPAALGQAASAGGADILSAVNTFVGMAIDTNTRRPVLSTVRGGLSGPAIKPLALRIVWDVARAVDLPVIAIGGIETVDDVLEYLLAGASAVPGRHGAVPRPQDSGAPRRWTARASRGGWCGLGGLPDRGGSFVTGRLERVAVALDTDDRDTYRRWCSFFGPRVGVLKVGPRVVLRWGRTAVEEAARTGAEVFLDFKFHDIPSTVAGAVGGGEGAGRLLPDGARGRRAADVGGRGRSGW